LIEGVVEKFELTSDQERAFRIIANHAVTPGSEQLIMYVGGMAGTGKSQSSKHSELFLNPEMISQICCFGTHRNCSSSSAWFNLPLNFRSPH